MESGTRETAIRLVDVSLPNGASTKEGADFYQPMDDIPKGIASTSKASAIKLTPQSSEVRMRKNAILAHHRYNVPYQDGALYVANRWKKLDVLADNYDRTHTDSFFQANPDLLMLNHQQAAELQSLSGDDFTAYLKANRQEFVVKVCNRLYHYTQAVTTYVAALANMCMLSRLNGNGIFKTISKVFRSANINSITNMYAQFPKVIGSENLIIDWSRYAVGMSSTYTDIVSIGLWAITTVGNKGTKLPDFRQFITSNKQRSNLYFEDSPSAEAKLLDKVIATTLQLYETVDHREKTYDGWKRTVNSFTSTLLRAASGKADASAVLGDVEIENGTNLVLQYTDGTSFGDKTLEYIYATNRQVKEWKRAFTVSGMDDSSKTNNLINRVLDEFMFIQQYMLYYFMDFTNPESDWYQLFVQSDGLKELEPSMKVDPFLTAIRKQDAFDMQSMAEKMIYKGSNRPITSSIIKWVPIIDRGSYKNLVSGNFEAISDTFNRKGYSSLDDSFYSRYSDFIYDDLDDAIADIGEFNPGLSETQDLSGLKNWLRYDPRHKTAAEYLAESQAYPHIVPSIFNPSDFGDTIETALLDDRSSEWLVKNATPEMSFVGKDEGTAVRAEIGTGSITKHPYSCARHPSGAAGSIMDLLSTCTVARDVNQFDISGLSQEDSESFVKRNDAYVFSEYPVQPYVYQQPILDSTDIYQCGFDVVFTSDDELKNEWGSYYQAMFAKTTIWLTNDAAQGNPYLQVADHTATGEELENPAPSFGSVDFGAANQHFINLAHVANKTYLEAIGTAFVFVGAGIFGHPVSNSVGLTAGNPMGGIFYEKSGFTGSIKTVKQALADELDNYLNDFYPNADYSNITDPDALFKAMSKWNPNQTNYNATAARRFALMLALAITDSYEPGLKLPHYGATAKVRNPIYALTVGFKDVLSVETERFVLSYVYFDPRYGAITPITYDAPKGYATPNALSFEQMTISDAADGPDYVGEAQFKFGPKVLSTCYDNQQPIYDVNFLLMPMMTWSRGESPQSFYLWFLSDMKWNTWNVDTNGIITRNDILCSNGGFRPIALAGLSVLQQVLVRFMGIEDTKDFWTFVNELKPASYDKPATTSFFDTNDLVFKARASSTAKENWNMKIAKMKQPRLTSSFSQDWKGEITKSDDARPGALKGGDTKFAPKGEPTGSRPSGKRKFKKTAKKSFKAAADVEKGDKTKPPFSTADMSTPTEDAKTNALASSNPAGVVSPDAS